MPAFTSPASHASSARPRISAERRPADEREAPSAATPRGSEPTRTRIAAAQGRGASRPAIAQVIKGEFCIGCGACSAVDPAFKVQPARNGELRVLETPSDPAALAAGSRVCPFGDAPDEDQLADRLFADAQGRHDEVGRYIDLYAGWSLEQRGTGGSGGLTRWLLCDLLKSGEIDFVVQVDRKIEGQGDRQDLFSYAIHEDPEEFLRHTSTSAYFPVTLQEVLKDIAGRDGVCAVTALPCFSRALRALMLERPEFEKKIRFISGAICGSLKSRRYAEYLAQQMGVAPSELDRVNFRGKSLSRAAMEKCVEIWRAGAPDARPDSVARVQDLKGTRYDHGYFKYKGCDYCDDVLAETADIAFGDAWLKGYRENPQGTNVVVVRNAALAARLKAAQARGEIHLEPLTAEEVAQSQGGGLRHRRDGLAIRLKFAQLVGAWTPRKRVRPGWRGASNAIVQIQRVAVRRVTSSARLSPSGPAFAAALGGVLWMNRVLDLILRAARTAVRRR